MVKLSAGLASIVRSTVHHQATHLQNTPLDELDRQIDALGSDVLAHVLAKGVISRASIIASIEVIVEQEVYGSNTRHLESINWLALVLLGSEKLLDLVDGQEAS